MNKRLFFGGRRQGAVIQVDSETNLADNTLFVGGGGKGQKIQLGDIPLVMPAGGAADMGKFSLEGMERQHIARVLTIGGGNLFNVAQNLRINRSTLQHKIKKYGPTL